jgi:hypothetical protein
MYWAMRAYLASSLVAITVREYRNWGSWGMLNHTLLLVYNTTKIQLIVELWTHVCATREAFPVTSYPEAHLNISLVRATPTFSSCNVCWEPQPNLSGTCTRSHSQFTWQKLSNSLVPLHLTNHFEATHILVTRSRNMCGQWGLLCKWWCFNLFWFHVLLHQNMSFFASFVLYTWETCLGKSKKSQHQGQLETKSTGSVANWDYLCDIWRVNSECAEDDNSTHLLCSSLYPWPLFPKYIAPMEGFCFNSHECIVTRKWWNHEWWWGCPSLWKTTIVSIYFAHASPWLFIISITKPFLFCTPSQMHVED